MLQDFHPSTPRGTYVPQSPQQGASGREVEVSVKLLADRITEVRHDLYGDVGIPALVESLDVSRHTWMSYEAGAVMPDSVLLRFLMLTAVEPHWLLTGAGPKYRWPRR